MSFSQFIQNPFPDNHDGFDYSPKSFKDIIDDSSVEDVAKQNAKQQSKLMSMLTSIFK